METTQEVVQDILDLIQNSNSLKQLAQCLAVLQRLINNIVNNPLDLKFRTIKSHNAAIKSKVLVINNINKLLVLLGYTISGDDYILPDQNINQLLENACFIDWRKRLIQGRLNSSQAYKAAQEVVKNQKLRRMQQKREQQQQERLRKQTQNDKKQRIHMKIDTSKSNQLKFGTNEKTWKDIGVDLCKNNK